MNIKHYRQTHVVASNIKHMLLIMHKSECGLIFKYLETDCFYFENNYEDDVFTTCIEKVTCKLCKKLLNNKM